MRKITIILALLVSVWVSAFSQISVKSFVELSSNLDATTNFPKKDLNGKNCAIIKVFTTQKDFSFDNGMLGIVAVEYKPAEIWLYVPEKTRKLKITHPQLGHLSNVDDDEGYYWFPDGGVKAGGCYKMELVTGKVRTIVEEAKEKTGWLLFESVPEGADIYLVDDNGEENYIGTTPMSKKMIYGRYNYRAKKYNYCDNVGVAVVDKTRVIMDLQLRPAFGSISITSQPQGAKVILNGQDIGKITPCVIDEVASGSYDVRLLLKDYAPGSRAVTVSDGVTVSVDIALEARFASVFINSLPGAEIKINGVVSGRGTYSSNMQEGIYDIEVSLASHRTVTKQIEVVAGVPQTIDLRPEPIYGTLDVNSSPMGANISINGKNYGDTPTTIENLLIGDYDVVLSKEGYESVTKRITIAENAPAEIDVTLKNENSEKQISKSTVAETEEDKKILVELPLNPNWSADVTPAQRSVLERLIANMVKVEGGKFIMGATKEQKDVAGKDEKPTRKRTLSTYYIGKYEVQQEEWEVVMGKNPSICKGINFPIGNVTWYDCIEFVEKLNQLTGLNFSLPTETQWEYAARGGKSSMGYMYSGSDNVGDVAWYDNNSNNKTHSVGAKAPNELGLYDMSGNVYEWCDDWYDAYGSRGQFKPTNKVYRGGGCGGIAWRCRVSCRGLQFPTYRHGSLGLRLVHPCK